MTGDVVRRRWIRLARLVAVTLASAYLLALGLAFAFQRALIYRPEPLAADARIDAGVGAKVVAFRAPGGPRVSALYSAPPDARAPVVLIVHGNAGNLSTWSPVLSTWVRLGCGALLLDPRGYGSSEGSPTEEGLLADGAAAVDWLAGQGIGADRLILHGISIGGGVAVPLAADRQVRGLVLESPFTCLADAAGAHLPLLPCRLLLLDRYDNVASAARVRCPVFVLHGDEDEVVPVEQGRRLAAAFPKAARFVVVHGYHHNDLSEWPGHAPALEEFVRGLR